MPKPAQVLMVTRLQFDAGDAMLFLVPGALLVLMGVAAPPLLNRWLELGIPIGWPRVVIEVVFAAIAILVLVHIIFKRKAVFKLGIDRLYISYPLRLYQRGATFAYKELELVRIGEHENDYWMRLFLYPKPGHTNEIEIRFEAYEADLLELCRELENLGVEAAYYAEQ